jgi:hypothetical protein
MHIHLLGPEHKTKDMEHTVDISDGARGLCADLHPNKLKPLEVNGLEFQVFENAWQYMKVYEAHIGKDGKPTKDFFDLAKRGAKLKRAIDTPTVEGSKPSFIWFNGKKFSGLEARVNVLIPFYMKSVEKTRSWKLLREMFEVRSQIGIYADGAPSNDAWTIRKAVFDPTKPLCHSYMLAMLLIYGSDMHAKDLP